MGQPVAEFGGDLVVRDCRVQHRKHLSRLCLAQQDLKQHRPVSDEAAERRLEQALTVVGPTE